MLLIGSYVINPAGIEIRFDMAESVLRINEVDFPETELCEENEKENPSS